MQEILLNVLIFCAIVLLITLIVGVALSVIILIDVRRTTRKITRQVEAVASIFDIGSLLLGGLEGAKKRILQRTGLGKNSLVALIAGIKKGLQVLLNKPRRSECRGEEEKENG